MSFNASSLYAGIPNSAPYLNPVTGVPQATSRIAAGLGPEYLATTPTSATTAELLAAQAARTVPQTSWMGGLGADVAAGGGLAGRAATFARGPFGPAAIGTAASMGIRAIPLPQGATSTQDVLANAAMGAGVGGTLAGFLGPEAVPIGAAAGGILAGGGTILANIFGGDENKSKDDLRNIIGGTAKAYGFNDEVFKQRFDLAVKAGQKDAQGNPISQEQIAQSMADSIIAQHQQEVQSKEQMAWQGAQHQADLQAGLTLQSQARDFFSPYTNNIIAAGASQADVLNKLADQVPGAYKGVFQAQASNALANAQQMAGAYAAQVALMPGQMAMAQTAQANASEIANQAKLFQYASQMGGRGGAGGGGTDIQSLLAQGGQYNQQAGV